MTVLDQELAGCIRAWRERLSVAEAGLPAARHRRVPGLRREEVARLAGLSVDYLARLEQGRAHSPSPSVLASLARALRLSDDERSHLYRLAGHAEPGPGTINRHITPSLRRLLDRLADVPVMLVDGASEIITLNALATALLGDLSGGTRRERTLAWRHFTGLPSRLVWTAKQREEAEAGIVAQLRKALGRFPHDKYLNSLIEDLLECSPAFAGVWELRPVAGPPVGRKTFDHPELGEITLDCDELAVAGTDLTMVVYTAPAGSTHAKAVALLETIGLQRFSD
ncbi:MAG: helix-turn-helix domain-containing protein [Chloroflexi bacterium]|nr:helix-turn-helix domain-containing protein [Chloroflexota bacterium]